MQRLSQGGGVVRLLRLLFVFVALALSLEAAWNPTCTSFVYVNGINTPNLGAAKTVTDFLQPQFLSHLTSKGKAGSCYGIHLFYNTSTWWGADLIESAKLFFNQNSTALDRFIDHNELIQTGTSTEQTALTFAMTNTPKSGVTNTFALTKTAFSTIDVIKKLPPSEQITTGDLVSRLLTEINAGKTAVCVGHSEGNFFCNLAYKIIAEDNLITFQTLKITQPGLSKLGLSLPDVRVLQLVGIATPANFTADGRNRYVTVCKDAILATPNALPANYPSITSCVPNWWSDLWKLTTAALFYPTFSSLLQGGSVAINYHLIETYLTKGSGTQQRIMEILEESLPTQHPQPPTSVKAVVK